MKTHAHGHIPRITPIKAIDDVILTSVYARFLHFACQPTRWMARSVVNVYTQHKCIRILIGTRQRRTQREREWKEHLTEYREWTKTTRYIVVAAQHTIHLYRTVVSRTAHTSQQYMHAIPCAYAHLWWQCRRLRAHQSLIRPYGCDARDIVWTPLNIQDTS